MPILRVGKRRKKNRRALLSLEIVHGLLWVWEFGLELDTVVSSLQKDPPLKNQEKAVKSSFQVGELLQLCPWLPSLSVFATTKLSCRRGKRCLALNRSAFDPVLPKQSHALKSFQLSKSHPTHPSQTILTI